MVRAVRSCVICKSTPQPGVERSFLRLPYEYGWRVRWISLISDYVGSKISTDSLVCTDHFSSDDYESINRVKILKRSAVPTLPNSHNQTSHHQIIKQIENNSCAKEANINPNKDSDEDIVKIEIEEIIIKDEVAMDNCCGECTNTFSDSDVQMTDVEKVEACEDWILNTMPQESETNYLGSTFDPDTKSVIEINTNSQDKTSTMVNVGNFVARLVPEELPVEDKILEFDESEKASSSEGLTNITVFLETVDRENERETGSEAEIECPKNLKFSAQERENRLIRENKQLESELKTQNLYIDKLHKENQSLTDRLQHATQPLQKKIDHLLKVLVRLQMTENPNDLEKSLDLKTSECLDYKNRLLNVCQELAHVKVKLTNCEEEKAKLEKNLGLEEMRKEIDVLKKKCQDMYESHRLTAIKENELNQEILSLKAKLMEAKQVCWLLGLRSEDLSLEKVEEEILNSKEVSVPKCWESRIKTRRVKELEKKTKECIQLKKELARLRKRPNKVCKSNDVCEYCGM